MHLRDAIPAAHSNIFKLAETQQNPYMKGDKIVIVI